MSLLPGGDPYIPTLEVSAGISWVLSVWFVAVAIAVYLRKNGAEHPAAGVLWAFALSMLFEGCSFAIGTFKEYHIMNDPSASGTHDFMLRTALWGLSQCFSGGMGWVAALYLMMTSLAPRTIWMIGIGSGTFFGVLLASLKLMGNPGAEHLAKLIFVVYFESMQATLGIATIRIYLNSKMEKAASGLLSIGVGGMLLLHVFQMSFSFGFLTRTSWSLPLKLWLNCPVVLVTAYAMVKISEQRAYDEVSTSAATAHRSRRLKDTVKCYAFPEYFWGLTLVFNLAGYGLSALCLFFVTKRLHPDMMQHDAVYAMYSTYHPCILLDYLPGTFLAQPLFDLYCVAGQVCAVLAFVRTCCGGDLFSMMHVGATTVFLLFATTIFELVFTFNPSNSHTGGALGHSVPFMFNQVAIALFMTSQMFAVYYTVDSALSPGAKKHFLMWGSMFVAVEVGLMIFMAQSILLQLGFGNADGKLGMAMDPNVPIDNGDVVFNWVPFLGAIVQIFNVWLYSLVCPLKFRPLVCHVSTSDVSTGAPPPPAANKRGAFHVNVSTRVFLRASAICMFLVGITCYYLNKWVLGDEAIHLFGFREHLHTAPGVVVVAVGWIVCAVLFGLHVLVVCFYESMRNLNSISVVGIEIAGAITFFAAFLMHADTIPHASKDYPWFMGAEIFLISLAVWVSVNISVCHFGSSMAKPPCATPVDFVLVLDESGSMKKPLPDGSTPIDGLKAFAKFLVSSFNLGPNAARFSVVSFQSVATTQVGWSTNQVDINAAIDQMDANGDTSITAGFEAAASLLTDSRPGATQIVLLFSDGRQDDEFGGSTDAIASADLVKASGATVFAWGMGKIVDEEAMTKIATDASKALFVKKIGELSGYVADLEAAVCNVSKVCPKALMVDGIVGTALVVAIITAVGGRVIGLSSLKTSVLADVAWVVLLFIFSFTDPRKCKLHIDRIHVATNDEIVSKMDDSFWGVPFFMCDLWGMKATLKSNRALL